MCLHPSQLAHDLAHDDAEMGHNGSSPAQVLVPQRLRQLARLRLVRDRIDREHELPLDVEALARGVHMPAGHLSREFRCAYGLSPYGYLTVVRNREAPAAEPHLA